jgi:hypothetical protein
MEYTTIKVTKITKEKLFRLASNIQLESGKKITLDEAIEYLLSRNVIDTDKIKSVRSRLAGLDLSSELIKGRSEDD